MFRQIYVILALLAIPHSSFAWNNSYGEVLLFLDANSDTVHEYVDEYINPEAPPTTGLNSKDLEKSCADLYYEVSALEEYVDEPDAHFIDDPYTFLTSPNNAAALLASQYVSSAYHLVTANAIVSDQEKRISFSLRRKKHELRTIMARKQCFQ
jgi:hypothetical protein